MKCPITEQLYNLLRMLNNVEINNIHTICVVSLVYRPNLSTTGNIRVIKRTHIFKFVNHPPDTDLNILTATPSGEDIQIDTKTPYIIRVNIYHKYRVTSVRYIVYQYDSIHRFMYITP